MSPYNNNLQFKNNLLIRVCLASALLFLSQLFFHVVLPDIFPQLPLFELEVVECTITSILALPCLWWFVFKPSLVAPLLTEAHQKLQKSEARFRNLADFAPVGIYETDAQGKYIFVNRKWCDIMGLSIDQALGNGWLSAIHPEAEQLVAEEWDWVVGDGWEFMMEYRVRDATNPDKRVFDSAAPFKDEGGELINFMGIVIDVTKRHQSEAALRESEARFRTMFDHSEDAIILFVPGTCTILDVNGTTERLYGYSKEEMIGLDSHLLSAPFECDDCITTVCELTGSGVRNIDHLVNRRKDGTELHLSVRAKFMKVLGDDVIYCTMRDIGPRLQMEKEALAMQSQMIHSNKMNSLGLLVAGIAHEINNPNNYIMVNAQMLYKIWEDLAPLLKDEEQRKGDFNLGGLPYTKLEEALPEMITAINDGSRRIKNIVSVLKNYSRKGKAASETLDINNVVAASMMLLKHHVKKFTDNFVLDLEEGTPRIMGSSQQLEQVIINLVTNALQSLTDRKQRLSLKTSFSAEKRAVLLIVTDEGCGIPDGVKSRIMEPFFTTRIDCGGTGLGLSIARSIVLAHHGEIDIASRLGEGTVVTVSLPVAEKYQEGDLWNV